MNYVNQIFIPNFQKGGLDRTLVFRGGLLGKRERGGDFKDLVAFKR